MAELGRRLAAADVQRPHVQARYLRWFRRFATAIDWDRWTAADLEGPQGRQAILTWLGGRPPRFRRSLARTIKSVWTQAANLQWPLVERRDLRHLPPPRVIYPPDEDSVRHWHEGVLRHPNERERLICLLILETGIRPEQLSKLRVEDARRDAEGIVTAIVASGADHGFKKPSDLVVRLAPAVARMLQEWLRGHPAASGWLLPRYPGRWDLQTKPDQIRYTFRKVARRSGVPPLTPRHLRHWVARMTRNARMQEFAACRHQGWQSPKTTMHDHYGIPTLDDILREQQRCLPHGLGGLLGSPKTTAVEGGADPTTVPLRTEGVDLGDSAVDSPLRPFPASEWGPNVRIPSHGNGPITIHLRFEVRIDGRRATIRPKEDGPEASSVRSMVHSRTISRLETGRAARRCRRCWDR